MNLKRKIATRVAGALMAAMMMVAALPSMTAEARQVTRAEQIVFLKNVYACTKEMGEKYGIPYQAGLATFCWESGYGTNDFARWYNNISGVGCYNAHTCVCRYSSYEECIEGYFRLLADEYKLRGVYGDPSAVLGASAKCGFNRNPGYADHLCSMLREVQWLEGEVVASLEADAEVERQAEAERKAEMMAKLADESIMIIDAKAESDDLRAGAVAAMHPQLKEITVGKAAQKILKGKLGDSTERRAILGHNYKKVRKYLEYITVPT